MREPSVAIALSVLVHGAAIAWFASRDDTERLRLAVPTARRVEMAAQAPPSPELEVVLLDDGTSAQFGSEPAQSIGARPTSRSRRGESRVVAAMTQTTEPAPTAPEPPKAEATTATKKKFSLAMRTGPDITIHRPGSDGISDAMLEKMVNGELDPRIANLPGAREDAAYERAQAKLHSRRWVDGATPEQVAAARLDRMAARDAQRNVELVVQKDGTHTTDTTTFTATVNRDGTVAIKGKPDWQQKSWFYAEFDVGAALMRSQGMDAYASAKRAYLDRTRDQRVEIGKRYRSEQLARSAQIMASNLERLWSTVKDPAERKELLFALWDECAEAGDDELVDAAAEARRLVINFIQIKRVTYSAAELSALNAKKQSRARFAP